MVANNLKPSSGVVIDIIRLLLDKLLDIWDDIKKDNKDKNTLLWVFK
ncbi:MAG: hypothetical protein QS748_02570 [Candidatus Endonucleobacter bathymodioli]|uniref:Uncharacterized protein n=1 Tax=Candidatus Endonucleibacter bathymodioli TaxID=539814 RepID=A0AA90SS06_9GAMM|nr:hypothetical protein [Candidatus Endonucleobacter bathymodioli]